MVFNAVGITVLNHTVCISISIGGCVGVGVDVGGPPADLAGSVDHRVPIDARKADPCD